MTRTGRWLACGLGLAASLVAATRGAAAPADDDRLVGASSDEHMWIVVEGSGKDGGVRLANHTAAMEGPYLTPLVPLRDVPDVMAAWGKELWIVYPARPDGDRRRREVFHVRVRYDPTLKLHTTEPSKRLEKVEPLPPEGQLASFLGMPEGPVALLIPTDTSRVGEARRSDQEVVKTLEGGLHLLQLTGQQWKSLVLPDDFDPTPNCHLIPGGPAGHGLHLIAADGIDPGRVVVHSCDDIGGPWTRQELRDVEGRIEAVTRTGAHPLLIIAEPGSSRMRLDYFRNGALLSLARFDRPAGDWIVLGMREEIHLIERAGVAAPETRSIDRITGEIGAPEVMARPPIEAGDLLGPPLLLAALIAAGVLVFLLRPSRQPPATLPAGWEPLPPMRRLVALLLDLVPSGLLTLLVLRCDLADLLRPPMLTTDFSRTGPYLMLTGLTMVHTTISELAGARTLGKMLLGARVVSAKGVRPRPAQVLARNLLKGLILIIPVLAVVAFFNRNLQGLNDLAARTLVVGPEGADVGGEPGGESGDS